MATPEQWPKAETEAGNRRKPKRCCICARIIQPGEKYHHLFRKGAKYFHADCYATRGAGPNG